MPHSCRGCLDAQVCVSVTDACTGAPLSGWPVTLTGPATYGGTSDASGRACIAVTQAGTYSASVPARSGYGPAAAAGIVVSACGSTVNANLTPHPGTVPWTFNAALCAGGVVGGCVPNASYPVTVTVSGAGSGTCTISSSAGRTINISGLNSSYPSPASYTVTYSCPGFVTVTKTVNPSVASCSVNDTAGLSVTSGWSCYPEDSCVGAMPATLTLTADATGWGITPWYAGQTFTLTYQGAGSSPNYAVCVPDSSQPGKYARFTASVHEQGCASSQPLGITSASVSSGYTNSACTTGGAGGLTWNTMASGTPVCPVACHLTDTGNGGVTLSQ